MDDLRKPDLDMFGNPIDDEAGTGNLDALASITLVTDGSLYPKPQEPIIDDVRLFPWIELFVSDLHARMGWTMLVCRKEGGCSCLSAEYMPNATTGSHVLFLSPQLARVR
eukprot:759506-Hanusia_phi.AAC.3